MEPTEGFLPFISMVCNVLYTHACNVEGHGSIGPSPVRRTDSGEEKMWKNTLFPGIFHKGPSLTGLRVKVSGAIECWQVVTQAMQMWESICNVVIIQHRSDACKLTGMPALHLSGGDTWEYHPLCGGSH